MARKQETRAFKVTGAGEGSEPEEVEIMITALDGNTAGELGIRLLQIFGPSMVAVVAAMESNAMEKVTENAGAFFAKLTPAEFKAMLKTLLRGAQATELGEFKAVDEAFIAERFAGHVGSLYALAFFALKVNFRNFFDDLGISKDRLQKLMPKAQAKVKNAIS